MRVAVDLDLCQGHGVCENEAPGIFELAKNSSVTILDDTPGDDRRAEVEAAVRYCPTAALRIIDVVDIMNAVDAVDITEED